MLNSDLINFLGCWPNKLTKSEIDCVFRCLILLNVMFQVDVVNVLAFSVPSSPRTSQMSAKFNFQSRSVMLRWGGGGDGGAGENNSDDDDNGNYVLCMMIIV